MSGFFSNLIGPLGFSLLTNSISFDAKHDSGDQIKISLTADEDVDDDGNTNVTPSQIIYDFKSGDLYLETFNIGSGNEKDTVSRTFEFQTKDTTTVRVLSSSAVDTVAEAFEGITELVVDSVNPAGIGPGMTNGFDLSKMVDLVTLTLRVDDEWTINFPESTWGMDVLDVSLDRNRRSEYYNTTGTSRVKLANLSNVTEINCDILDGTPADIPSGTKIFNATISQDFTGDTQNGIGSTALTLIHARGGPSATWRGPDLAQTDLEKANIVRSNTLGDIHPVLNNCPNLYSYEEGRNNTGDLRDSTLTNYPPLEYFSLGFGQSKLEFGFTDASALTNLTFYRHLKRFFEPLAELGGLLIDDNTTWTKSGSAGEELKAFHQARSNLKSGLTLDVVQRGKGFSNPDINSVFTTLLEDICWRVLGIQGYTGLVDVGVSVVHDSIWGGVTVNSFSDPDSDSEYEQLTVQNPNTAIGDTRESSGNFEIATTQLDSNGDPTLVWESVFQAGNYIRLRDTNGDVAEVKIASVTNNGDGTTTIDLQTAIVSSNVDESSAEILTYSTWDGIA